MAKAIRKSVRHARIHFSRSPWQHRPHRRLKKVRGWVPTEFTESGQPQVDDSIISRLPYPEAPIIAEYLLVSKRIQQLAEGDEAWLHKVENGRIQRCGLQASGR